VTDRQDCREIVSPCNTHAIQSKRETTWVCTNSKEPATQVSSIISKWSLLECHTWQYQRFKHEMWQRQRLEIRERD